MNSTKKKTYAQLPHILIVDDDERICTLVSRYLMKHDFLPLCAHCTKDARALLSQFVFDAMIVDVMMPGETGLNFTQDIKKMDAYSAVPVLMLSALGEVDDRIAGFEAGVDDYLPKPFEAKELLMRLEAILRRTKRKGQGSVVYKIATFEYNLADETLRHGEDIVALTEMEARLLKVLAQHAGEVLDRETLNTLCELEGGERTIDVQITRLRRKIEPDTKKPRYLQTLRGKGYVLKAELVE